jgi:hypothetical protein
MNIDLDTMISHLQQPIDSPQLRQAYGDSIEGIERSAHYGFVQFQTEGISVIFKEAPWVIPKEQITDPLKLYLSAFHLHVAGHEGYQQFKGKLPHSIHFGDSKARVLELCGEPLATGGGMLSKLLNKKTPSWVKYKRKGHVEHYQFNSLDQLELVTVFVEDQPLT